MFYCWNLLNLDQHSGVCVCGSGVLCSPLRQFFSQMIFDCGLNIIDLAWAQMAPGMPNLAILCNSLYYHLNFKADSSWNLGLCVPSLLTLISSHLQDRECCFVSYNNHHHFCSNFRNHDLFSNKFEVVNFRNKFKYLWASKSHIRKNT